MNPASAIVVAVSQRVDRVPGREETRDALDQALVQWLAGAGCIAVPVPNTLPMSGDNVTLGKWVEAVSPSMIVLSGGNDIGGVPQRDATEAALLSWAAHGRKPVLGICRGMEMMGIYAGGKLSPVTGHVRIYHELGDGGSPVGWPGRINSYHDFALADVPPSYKALARSGDGMIEAMRHVDLPWEGWMWHPERDPVRRQDIERFLSLLK